MIQHISCIHIKDNYQLIKKKNYVFDFGILVRSSRATVICGVRTTYIWPKYLFEAMCKKVLNAASNINVQTFNEITGAKFIFGWRWGGRTSNRPKIFSHQGRHDPFAVWKVAREPGENSPLTFNNVSHGPVLRFSPHLSPRSEKTPGELVVPKYHYCNGECKVITFPPRRPTTARV